jgi:RimJ/RimL family protein N-acetyltransferase
MIEINNLDLLKFSKIAIHGRVTEDVGDVFPSEKYACMGEFKPDGQALWAVSVYDFRRDHDCILDVALSVDGLFSRALFEKIARAVCNYTFVQNKLLRMTTFVRVSNKKSYRITKRWGFREEGLIKLGFGPPNPEDMYVFGMTREECKWI